MKFYYKNNTDSILILIILLTGIILRFYKFHLIPFTHDEFSALFRTEFQSFSELINIGIKPDGHPAGIQVFLYFWTKFLGKSELVVKLPFLISGIASIYLCYLIPSRLFGKTTGLIVASIISSIEYTLMYSQIARPYIIGMFFSLLMVYFWINIIQEPDRKRLTHLAGFTLSATLCLYTHYFSFLLAVLIGITGIFLLRGKNLRNYLISGLITFILFLPHINITLQQLKTGGVGGWLGEPHNDFILQYFKYIFHFSPIVYTIITIILISGIITLRSFPAPNKKMVLILLSWFIISFLTGFLYSRYHEPVLQYSVLIFSFPFLLMGLFSIVRFTKPVYKLVIVFLILTVNISTLINQRKYYQLFYNSPYREIISEARGFSGKYPGASAIMILDIPEKIADYYIGQSGVSETLKIYSLSEIDKKEGLLNFLRTSETPYLIYGCESGTPEENFAIIIDYYPGLIENKNYSAGNYYIFSKKKDKNLNDTIYYSLYEFDSISSNWKSGNKNNYSDSLKWSGKYSYHYKPDSEFGPAFSIPLWKTIQNENNMIDIRLKANVTGNFTNALLVVSLESRGKIVDWRSSNFNDYSGKEGLWFTVYHSLKLADIYLKYPDLILNVYVWNNQNQDFFIDDFEILSRKGNPIIYGLVEKIPVN